MTIMSSCHRRLDILGAGNSSADGEDVARLDRWHQPELQGTGNLQVSDRGTSHGHIVAQLRSNAADRGILDWQAPASSSTAACRTGSIILTAKPIADRSAEGERRNPGQDDLDAADVLDLDSWPGTDTSLGHLTVRNPARGHARERCGEADIRDQTPRPQEDTADRSAHPSPRITLSDEAAETERAHSRLA